MPITQNQGSTAGGQTVTVTGTDLGGATAVNFGTKPAAITGNTAGSVSVITPTGAGVVGVTVVTPGGVGGPEPFFYLPPPVILSVSPGSGPVAGGSTITISGRYLASATTVQFGGSTVTPTVVSDQELTVVSPTGAASTVALAVVTLGGTASTAFRFVDPPTATGFSPLSGLPAGGTLVGITGTNLLTTTGVTFGAVPATFAVLSDTEIAAMAPAHAPGTVTITVTTTGGNDAAPGTFLYLL
ncbi:cell surface protein [Streptomyces lunaelactis]|uniref:Cell surface protein n=1 Tax=Streptomyces lunaelactis TaxID=1535768 RepID=A0A2R4TCI9_9ACTN|nr:IPT/TIG domain-containing protein [Streptomyces lunaelactis]AVZ76801.1 cell surface protein [Streptomyces lunaelactis]NUK84607.1 IPT/TIG domain-containing protein [Streptomyces lunaelactis]